MTHYPEKTYRIEERKKDIVVEDKVAKFSFLLELDENGTPKAPWIGFCITSSFIDGRSLGYRKAFAYLGHLEDEARAVIKNYLIRKYGSSSGSVEIKKEEKPYYWQKPPYDP